MKARSARIDASIEHAKAVHSTRRWCARAHAVPPAQARHNDEGAERLFTELLSDRRAHADLGARSAETLCTVNNLVVSLRGRGEDAQVGSAVCDTWTGRIVSIRAQ